MEISDKLQLRNTFEAGGKVFRVPGYDEMPRTDRVVLRGYIDLIFQSLREYGTPKSPGIRELLRYVLDSGETNVTSEKSFAYIHAICRRLVKLGFLAENTTGRHTDYWPTMLDVAPKSELLLE
jgi:hypothetical protein